MGSFVDRLMLWYCKEMSMYLTSTRCELISYPVVLDAKYSFPNCVQPTHYALLKIFLDNNGKIINGLQMFIEVFMNFDLSGGPYQSALTPVLYLYQTGFEQMKMGEASTIGLMLAAIIYLLTMMQLKITTKGADA